MSTAEVVRANLYNFLAMYIYEDGWYEQFDLYDDGAGPYIYVWYHPTLSQPLVNDLRVFTLEEANEAAAQFP